MKQLPSAKDLRKKVDAEAPERLAQALSYEWSHVTQEILDHANLGYTTISGLYPATVKRLKELGYTVTEETCKTTAMITYTIKW